MITQGECGLQVEIWADIHPAHQLLLMQFTLEKVDNLFIPIQTQDKFGVLCEGCEGCKEGGHQNLASLGGWGL